MVEPIHAWAKRLDTRPVVRPSIRTAVVPTGHLLPQISRATRAVDLRGQPRGRPRNDRNLHRKGAQRPGQDLGLWMLKVERQQGQPSRRQPGWMDGIAPSMRKGMGPPPSALG